MTDLIHRVQVILEAKKVKKKPIKREDKHAVITFGRMNPITKGHEANINHIRHLAHEHNADPHVFLSQSHDNSRNPLDHKTKLKYARLAFGSIVKSAKHKDIIATLKHLSKKYTHMHVVAGGDRFEEFSNLLNKYNGKEYNFKSLKVHPSGQRDAGMSATHMRDAVKRNDYESFHNTLPEKLKKHGKKMFDDVKGNLKI